MAQPVRPDDPALLHVATDGAVATVTLDDPVTRNALSTTMMGQLEIALDGIAGRDDIRVAVLAAVGPAFCSGHDLRELRVTPAQTRPIFEQCSRLMTAIVDLPQPVIAAVQGVATAAGCQLAATCDLVVAADTARFGTPGVNIGLFCSTPMVALTRAIGRKAAMELLLTGELVDATTAQRMGLVNRVVPPAELAEAAASLATRIAAKSPVALRTGKPAFYRQAEMKLRDAYAYTVEVMAENMATEDATEGIDAFLGKRPPAWPGR